MAVMTSNLDPAIAARLGAAPTGWSRPSPSSTTPARCSCWAGWTTRPCTALLTTGRCTYWSRSRREYWVKGDTSGHVQLVKSVALDCDADTLLVKVDQVGAACHTGARTCFDADVLPLGQ